MKNREIKKKVCPWLSGIYKYDRNCLGDKCSWIALTKRFDYSSKPDPENPIMGLLQMEELPKKDWEYECGLVRNPTSNQAVEM
jgi:hypothetical protein